jgi:hypothetical protein
MSDSLATKVASMTTDINNIKNEIGEIKQLLKEHTQDEKKIWDKVITYIEGEMNKKADVWTENAIRWFIYLVASVFVLTAVGLIITHAYHIPVITQ